jgi:hypothetical protein
LVEENMQDRHIHLKFIRHNLDVLLAQAWQGYQQLGRGAMLVDVDQDGQPAPPAAGIYVSPKLLGAAGLEWPHLAIKRLVRTYDPLREIVIAILGGAGDSYRFGAPDKSPPQAFAVIGTRLPAQSLQPGELRRWLEEKTRRR